MLRLASDYVEKSSSSETASNKPQLDLLAMVRVFLRRWRTIVGILIAVLALAFVYLFLAVPKYTAEFDLLLDLNQRTPNLASDETQSSSGLIDPGLAESQVEIINSRGVVAMVVRSLDLIHDPMIMGPPTGIIGQTMTATRNWISDTIHSLLKLPPSPPPTVDELEDIAVDNLQKAIKVTRVGISFVLKVEVTGEDPVRTTQIANALADAYMSYRLQANYETQKRTAGWLQDRLKVLSKETSDAEAAVQRYKLDNNIVDTMRGLMSDQRLADANTQLSAAKNATSAVKARLDRIKEVLNDPNVINGTVPDALQDAVLNRLQAQYLDLAARERDLAARFGPNHEVSVQLLGQMKQIARTAHDELVRIAQSVQSDYEIAVKNENSVKANVDDLVEKANTTSKAQLRLRDLESQAQVSRALYDNMLQKMQEAVQQQSSPTGSASIISPATVPKNASSPRVLITLIAALAVGLGVGAIVALTREMLGNTLKTTDDVRNYAGLECLGVLPMVAMTAAMRRMIRKKPTPVDALGAHSPIARQTMLAPFSRFSETVRNVKVSIDLNRQSAAAPIIGIVSSLPKEGKTTVSSNLAFLTAQMGHRTLLIDADMHNPSLTRSMINKEARFGLVDLLEGRATLHEAAISTPGAKIDFIPANIGMRRVNSVSLLTSDAMKALLAAASEEYEYIFLDLPPIIPVVDVKAAAHLIDGFVFVVEWGRTSRDVVYEALMASEQVRESVIGLVLNKADPLELKRIESYRGPEYGSYYIESNAMEPA